MKLSVLGIMPDNGAVAAAGANNAAPNQQQQGGGGGGVDMWSVMKQFAFRLFIIYMISSFIRNWRQPPASGPGNGTAPTGPAPNPSRNMFPKFTPLDMYVYISEKGCDKTMDDGPFDDFNNTDALFWQLTDVPYGDWTGGPHGDGSFTFTGQISCGDRVQQNASLYMHVYVVKNGKSPDPLAWPKSQYSKRFTMHRCRRLNKYKKKRYQKTQNLLTGKTEATAEEVAKVETGVSHEILSHWHPNLTLNLVDDHSPWVKGTLPPPLDEYVEFDPVSGDYYPIFYFNDYWNLAADYQPINSTVKKLNLTLTYSPMSLFKWQLYAAQNMRNKWTSMLGATGGELFEEADEDQDSLKQAILDTNPYLLGMTVVVSLLHTVFEFLAFKNDIQFWRNRKSLEGLSVRSVLFNVFTSLIVLLYILDNETNFVVRVSVGIGLLIELWKIPKCMDVGIDRERKIFGIIPRITIKDKGSYVESSTKVYDMMAFKYLSWALFPLLGGYAVYSLLYQEHRGWYSWVLSMLYGFLLTFGFIMMTPQLFINYKLKSVAHLPWRMLTYKFLNTFIDDIFAFVIKMPTMLVAFRFTGFEKLS